MGAGDALHDWYASLEDKYYGFLDWLEGHNIPVYSVVDAIESAGIPSFPVFILLVLLIVGGIVFLLLPFVLPGESTLIIAVRDAQGVGIANAIVSLTVGDNAPISEPTNAQGIVEKRFPTNTSVTISVSKQGFLLSSPTTQPVSVTLSQARVERTFVLSAEVQTVSKVINLVDATGAAFMRPIQIRFSCSTNSSFSYTASSVSGMVTVNNIPPDCGLLRAEPITTGIAFLDGRVDWQTPGALSLRVTEEEQETGTVNVSVRDGQNAPVQGVNVKLLRENGFEFTHLVSPQTGLVSFTEVPVGRYYVFVNDLFSNREGGAFADFDSSAQNDIRTVTPGGSETFSVVLQRTVSGQIRLLVRDAISRQPVANATVSLLKNNVQLDSESTNAEGRVSFGVNDIASPYTVRVDHPSYLIATVPNVRVSSAEGEILLQPDTANTGASLTVTVVDPNNRPVENARVQLKKTSDGTAVSEVRVTGLDGKATFERLVVDSYFAVVAKDGFEAVTSESITVAERQENNLSVVINIGSGTLLVRLTDESLQPVASGNIRMRDATTRAVLEEGISELDGSRSFLVRADKKVFFEIVSNDFAPYTTIPYTVPVDSVREISVSLVQDIVKLDARLVGVWDGEEMVAADVLSAGRSYKARFLLLVPEDSEWSEAGVHVRTGSFDAGRSNIMEADYGFLKDVKSSANVVVKGTSFSPPNGWQEDSGHLTTGNSKWADAVFATPNGGAYEVVVTIQTADAAPIGSLLPLSYRAWGKAEGSVVRSPVDSVLGTASSASGKHALYAVTNDRFFSIGPTTLCNDQFCSLITIQDLETNARSNVVDEYPAQLDASYKLFFTLVSRSPVVYSNAAFSVGTGEQGLSFFEYTITDATGRRITGSANAAPSLNVTVGDVGRDATVMGELVFRTVKEGANRLNLQLLSNGETVLQKSVLVNVEGARDFNLNILPKVIVPFLNNDLLVQVADTASGVGLEGATVEVFVGDTVVVTGDTDQQGIFRYTLESPQPGAMVKLVARKNGYRTVVKEMQVASSLFTIIPNSISETLTVTGIFGFEKELIIVNHSTQPLTITNVTPSPELVEWFNTGTREEVVNRVVEPGKDSNIFWRVELNDRAKRLLQPVEVQGSLSITTQMESAGQSWISTIPVAIRIGFGNEVDDQNCLVFSPTSWTAALGTNENRTLEIKVRNACRSNAEFVPLTDLQAKFVPQGSDNVLGQLVLSNDFPGNQTVALSPSFQRIAAGIPANADPTLSFSFTPSPEIVSGKMRGMVVLQAVHPTNNGLQVIEQKIAIDFTLNNLASCVEVSPANLVVYSTPPGIGSGIYMQYGYGGYGGLNNTALSGAAFNTYAGAPAGLGGYPTGYNRFDYSGLTGNYYNNYLNGTQTINGNPTLVDYPERIYAANYPYANYSEPFYDTLAPFASNGAIPGYNGYQGANAGYYGNALGNFNFQNAFYGRTNQFRIRNNCTSPIEASFEPDPALLVNNQSVTVEPGKFVNVPVESTYYYGIYPLNVFARVAKTDQQPQPLSTINVNVLPANDPTQFENCIRLSTTIFKFNDFIQKPVRARVYNSCFAQGVRLDMDSISFTNQGYGEQQALREGSSGIIEAIEPVELQTAPGGFTNAEQVLEFEVFKNINYRPQLTGAPLTVGGPDAFQDAYGFRVWASGAYNRVQARAQLVVRYSTPQGMEQRKVFRVMVEDFWNLFGSIPPFWLANPDADAKACLIENALDYGPCISSSDFGSKQTYSFGARQILRVGPNPYGSSYPRTYYGNPLAGNLGNGNPVNTDAFQPSYAPTTVPQPYPYYAPNYSLPGNVPYGQPGLMTGTLGPQYTNVCGTLDRVTIRTRTITKNGIRFSFSTGASSTTDERNRTATSGNGQTVTLTIDKSGANKKGRTTVETDLDAEVFRQASFGITYMKIPVSVCVDVAETDVNQPGGPRPGVPTPETPAMPNPSTPASFYCPSGNDVTGETVYTNTFGKVLLDWSWNLGIEDTNGSACDLIPPNTNRAQNGYFCDAVQETISLVKKTQKTKALVQELQGTMATNENHVKNVVGESQVGEYKNTSQLVRWLKKQISITEHAQFANDRFEKKTSALPVVFFAKDTEGKQFLERDNGTIDKQRLSSSIQNALTAFSATGASATEKINQFSQVLHGLNKESTVDANAIIILINWNAIPAPDKATLLSLGAEDLGNNQFVLTLNEFGYLHEQLKTNCATTGLTTCTIPALTGTGNVTINTAFLSSLATYLNVQYVARHTTTMDAAYLLFIKEKAAWLNGTQEKAEEIWKQNRGSVNLMKDSYTTMLRDNFKSYYTEQRASSSAAAIINGLGEWQFSPLEITIPGIYDQVLEYSWKTANGSVKVSWARNANDNQNHENVLFYLPLDASLSQQGSGTSHDYGTGFEQVDQWLLNATEKASGTGKTRVSTMVLKDLSNEEVRKGRLVKLTTSNLEFSPTIPVGIGVTLSGSNNGLLLDFTDDSLDGKIVWNNYQEGRGSPNSVCLNGKGTTQFSLVQGNVSGVFFVPLNKQTVLQLVCSNQNATVQIKQGTLFSNPQQKTVSRTAQSTKESGDRIDIPFERPTNQLAQLKQLALGVKTSEVCVKVTKDQLELSWNPTLVQQTVGSTAHTAPVRAVDKKKV